MTGTVTFRSLDTLRSIGDGVIAMTPDAPLAESVARKLNEIDPRARPRVTRGMGWW